MADMMRIKDDYSFFDKVLQINIGLIVLLIAIAGVGFASLYSAANGSWDPWASRQALRFCVGLSGLLFVAMIDIKWWYKLAYTIYGLGFVLLVAVEVMGQIGMGAQRWIDLGFIKLQPSEVMKVAVVLALARYFHGMSVPDLKDLRTLIPPALMIIAPVALVLQQPDLGTSLMIVMAGVMMFFIAGAPLWLFIAGGVIAAASVPIAWQFLHEYQKKRVITFLNPESDPLGSGYHITQSKIAIGSGGLEGKGFLKGTQSHLNFLPEKQTDFIFTLWVEEFGLTGGIFLLGLIGAVFLYGAWIAQRCRHSFGRLLALGLTFNFSLYVFINVSMVMGLIPVVGAPLPLVSYGGTSMLAVLAAFGLVISCNVHRDSKLPRM